VTIDLPTLSQAALQLCVDDRAELARTLLESIPAPAEDDLQNDSLSVARQRAQELRDNPDMAIDNSEVIDGLRQAFP